MLLTFFLLVTPDSVRSDWVSNIEAATNPDDLIDKGNVFNEVSKNVLTEKFTSVEFLVPFPTYELIDFGNCPDQSTENGKNIRRLADFQNSLSDYITEFVTNTDERFFSR